MKTKMEIIVMMASVLHDELDALRRWQQLSGIFPDDVKRGMEISVDKIERVLAEVEHATN